MANATVGALRVTLGIDSAAFTEGLTQAQKQLKDAGSRLQSIGTKMAGVGLAVGAALGGAFAAVTTITGGLVELGNEAKTAGVGFEEFQKWKYVAEQAGVSIEALTDGLKEMQLRADEFVSTGAGSAAEAFTRIGMSSADLAKGLEDPAAMFDDIIVRMGKLDTAAQIRVADEIFGGTGGEQFVRLLGMGAEGIAKLKDEFVSGGGLISEEELAKAAEFQRTLSSLKSTLMGLGTKALMNSGLIEFFTAAIPKVMAFGKALIEYLGPKVTPIFDAFVSVVQGLANVIASIFGDNGSASSGVITFGEIIKRIFEASLQVITGMLEIAGDILNAFAALLRGDWSAMWTALGDAVKAVGAMIVGVFTALHPNVIASVSRMVLGVRDWLVNRFQSMVVGPIKEKIEAVGGFFKDLYIAVVGNSWIPDMVTQVGQWIAKLDDEMVRPVQDATAEAGSSFEGLGDQVTDVFKSISSKDWKGALGGLFDILGGQGGKLGDLGNLGKSLFKFLPGFARGGSFPVSGSGTTDSKVVAFRATPGERVDISTPRQQRQNGGGTGSLIQVAPSKFFDVHVQQITAPMVSSASQQTLRAAQGLIPSQMAKRQMYTTGRQTR